MIDVPKKNDQGNSPKPGSSPYRTEPNNTSDGSAAIDAMINKHDAGTNSGNNKTSSKPGGKTGKPKTAPRPGAPGAVGTRGGYIPGK